MRKLAVFACALGFVALVPAAAVAQYPGTTSTTTTGPPVAVVAQVAGTLAVGATTTIVSCGFSPGQVTTTLNGRMGPTDTVGADACARTPVAVLGANLVRVEGVQLAAECGTGANTLSVSGTAAAGGSRVVSTAFGLDCPAAETLLPRTGAMVVRWSLLAVALTGVGALLVLANRRRPAAA